MYFKIFISFYIMLGAILPSLYLLVIDDSVSTWDRMLKPSSFPEGLRYTVCASLIMIAIAVIFRPTKKLNSYNLKPLPKNVEDTLFSLGIIGLLVMSGLSLTFGMSQSGLTSQRPYLAVVLGYVGILGETAGSCFFFHHIRFNGFSRRLVIYLLFDLINLAATWSRSALVAEMFSILIGFAYSSDRVRLTLPSIKQIGLLSLVIVVSVISVFTGQLLRGNEIGLQIFLLEGFQRIFANNLTLFLAIDRFEEVQNILLDGQPYVLFDQLFSFIIPRTLYPSSMRYVELSGGSINEDQRGHVAGYAFGWLGVTYGVGGFYWGLVLLAIILALIFYNLRVCFLKSQHLISSLFFSVFAKLTFEFIGNLGIDSYCEKVFKSSLFAFIACGVTIFSSKFIIRK